MSAWETMRSTSRASTMSSMSGSARCSNGNGPRRHFSCDCIEQPIQRHTSLPPQQPLILQPLTPHSQCPVSLSTPCDSFCAFHNGVRAFCCVPRAFMTEQEGREPEVGVLRSVGCRGRGVMGWCLRCGAQEGTLLGDSALSSKLSNQCETFLP
jgi:hypothetical protein